MSLSAKLGIGWKASPMDSKEMISLLGPANTYLIVQRELHPHMGTILFRVRRAEFFWFEVEACTTDILSTMKLSCGRFERKSSLICTRVKLSLSYSSNAGTPASGRFLSRSGIQMI